MVTLADFEKSGYGYRMHIRGNTNPNITKVKIESTGSKYAAIQYGLYTEKYEPTGLNYLESVSAHKLDVKLFLKEEDAKCMARELSRKIAI